jgi:hypothetical protein
MPFSEFMSLVRQGTVQGSKSTAMTPLLIAVGTLSTAVLIGGWAGLSSWIVGLLATCLVLVVLCLVILYGYFAVKQPDFLRTERYSLTKLAIEQHRSGDDMAGLRDVIEVLGVEVTPTAALPTPGAVPAKAIPKKRRAQGEGDES